MIKIIFRVYLAVYIMTMGIIPVRQVCAQTPAAKSLAVLNLDAKGVSNVEADVISDQIRSHISRIVSSPSPITATSKCPLASTCSGRVVA